ncbi:MAG TPA: helix-turn-helix transcriptional regulator [Dehalococcoidia bacterium]|nr:helix-turn-helix transcriptional regulator [Dehalococcoidia bacterium]
MARRRVKRGEHLGRQGTTGEEKGPPRSLREVREGFPLSQHELAAWTGLSESTIQALEKRKRRPRPHTMRELARVLKVEVEDIAWW